MNVIRKSRRMRLCFMGVVLEPDMDATQETSCANCIPLEVALGDRLNAISLRWSLAVALDLQLFRAIIQPERFRRNEDQMTAKEWSGHLLIVDDEELVLDLIKRQLKDEGYDILSASSGEAALQLIKTHPIGVIVSDQSMPGMSGTTFLSKVRQIDDEVVLIMLTGNGTLESAVDAINQLKVFSYIMKPCSAAVMRSTIRNAFKHHEMTSTYRITLKRTYQLNEHLNKENARLTEYVKEMEQNMAKLREMQS